MLSLRTILSGEDVRIEDHPTSAAATPPALAPWLTRAIFAGASLLSAATMVAPTSVQAGVVGGGDLAPTAWSQRVDHWEGVLNAAGQPINMQIAVIDWDAAEAARLASGQTLQQAVRQQIGAKLYGGGTISHEVVAAAVDHLVAEYTSRLSSRRHNATSSTFAGYRLPNGMQACIIAPGPPDLNGKLVADQLADLHAQDLIVKGRPVGFDPAKIDANQQLDQIITHEGGHCLGGSQTENMVQRALDQVLNDLATRAGGMDRDRIAVAAAALRQQASTGLNDTALPPSTPKGLEDLQVHAGLLARAHVFDVAADRSKTFNDIETAVYQASAWARHINEAVADISSVDATGANGNVLAAERLIGALSLHQGADSNDFQPRSAKIKSPAQPTDHIDITTVYDTGAQLIGHQGRGVVNPVLVLHQVLAKDPGIAAFAARDRQMRTAALGDFAARPKEHLAGLQMALAQGWLSTATPANDPDKQSAMVAKTHADKALLALPAEQLRQRRDQLRAQLADGDTANDTTATRQIAAVNDAIEHQIGTVAPASLAAAIGPWRERGTPGKTATTATTASLSSSSVATTPEDTPALR